MFVLAGCGGGGGANVGEQVSAAPKTPVADKSPLIGLVTQACDTHSLKVSHRLPGKIEPDVGKEVDVSSWVTGRISSLAVSPGDVVQKGQVLAVLTSREVSDLEVQGISIKARLETARAQEARERVVYDEQVHIPKALIDARAAHREATTHLKLMKSQLERQEILYKEKIGAQKDLASAQAAFEQAQSDEQQSLSNVRREENFFKNKALLKAPLMKAEAERKQAEKELEALTSQLQLLGVDKRTFNEKLSNGTLSGVIKITAPISGILSFFDVATGELIQADQPVFRITDLSTVLISADVPASDITLVRLGSTLHVSVPSSSESVPATVSIVGNHVDPKTRTLPVRARINNVNGLFKPGMYADVQLLAEDKVVLAVPKSALQEVNGQKVVFVRTESGYADRKVITGAEGTDYIEILKGLSKGEEVVTEGSLLLKAQLSYSNHHEQ